MVGIAANLIAGTSAVCANGFGGAIGIVNVVAKDNS